MARLTRPLESATRKQIDLILTNLGWHTDEKSPDCNVFTERAKTREQDGKFGGVNPDYVLYRSGTDEPIAIVEAKRPGESVDRALSEAKKKYADPLDIKIVFAYDGAFFKSLHTAVGRELLIDGMVVTQLLPERLVLRFATEGGSISELTPSAKHTRAELIAVYDWANDLFRKEGLREGIDRFSEFANLLFLKLISEQEKDREKLGEPRILEDKYCWDAFATLPPPQMLSYINDTVLPYLVQEYNHSGDVFDTALRIKNPKTLSQIVDRLAGINLMSADTDVKGDAFEYFLRDSVTVGNDLGEYFTPRHIVNLMIELVEPRLTEKVYDPACGTAGFLISTFGYIKKRNARSKEVMRTLREETVFGRELTNTAKIAKMNMILTGDGHANIRQLDSLSEPVAGEYDVVLSNIPYGQTTDYGGLYPLPSNNGDSVFLQHAFGSLKPSVESRAAVVIPEGILFGKSMKKLREFFLKKCRVSAVISLPRGVFRPYVRNNKTDIVVFSPDSRGTESVWFYDLTADGFDLNSDFRRPVSQNDIPDLLSKWVQKEDSTKSWTVPVTTIAANSYRLVAKEYSPFKNVLITRYLKVPLETVASEDKSTFTIENSTEYALLTARWYGGGLVARERLMGSAIKVKEQKVAKADQLLVAQIDAKSGGYGIIPKELRGSIVSSHYYLFDLDLQKVRPKFLDYVLRFGPYEKIMDNIVRGTTNYADVRVDDLLKVEIPLPTLSEQDTLITDIDRELAIRDSAQTTLDLMDESGIDTREFPTSPTEKLPRVTKLNPQYALTSASTDRFVEMAALDERTGRIQFGSRAGNTDGLARFKDDDVIFARMTPCTENGKVTVVRGLASETGLGSTEFVVLSPDKSRVLPDWLYFFLLSRQVRKMAADSMIGTTGRERVPDSFFDELDVPVPTLSEQALLSTAFRQMLVAREGVAEIRAIADRSVRAIVKSICSADSVKSAS